MSAESATYLLWLVWYSTWIAAVIFSRKTAVQLRRDIGGGNRMLAGIGSLLLFLPDSAEARFFGWLHIPFAAQRLWPDIATLQWSLFAFVALGFVFCWWARLHLGRLWSGFVTLKDDHHIVDTGPYGLLRHPIYSGVMFSALMTAAIRATPAAFLGFVLLTVGFWLTARIEEMFLRDQLGTDAYGNYSKRVSMLVPGIY